MAVFHGFGGFFFGLAVPLAGGLYGCTRKNLKLADFSLRVLFFWVVVNQVVFPLLKVFFLKVSPSFWSLVYTAYPVALLVPKSNVLKILDGYVVTFLTMNNLSLVRRKLQEVCVASRRALANLVGKLEQMTTLR